MSYDAHQDGAEHSPLVRYQLDRAAMGYLYIQMADHLAKRIAAGELTANTTLPAEVQLARQYGVSLGTSRRATEVLRERGLVATLRSKGTFVVDRSKVETSKDHADEPETGWLAWVQELE